MMRIAPGAARCGWLSPGVLEILSLERALPELPDPRPVSGEEGPEESAAVPGDRCGIRPLADGLAGARRPACRKPREAVAEIEGEA
jgi:hypothetical protein